MSRSLPPVRVRRVLPVLLAALPPGLAGCAHRPAALVAAPPAPPVTVAAAPLAPAGPSPINAGLSPAATVWHLRAALNVAALACRAPGEEAMAARYNALLAAQRAPLAAAQTRLAAEYRAGGGDWRGRYDGAMTRLYNFFSAAPAAAHDRLCAAAARVMAQAAALPPDGLAAFARDRLPLLDAALADPAPDLVPAPTGDRAAPALPVIAIAAVPAPGRPVARPRLEIDLSALPPD